jgi:D-2-hydroxyacid dehydrogenase (NADP+)
MLMPYDARSHHIINASVFAAMPSEARLISVSRGNLIDEAALREALHSGQIAGAGLDVFAHEPLVPSDPIWTAPNTIITPHIGGMSDIFKQQALHHMTDNMIAFATGGAGSLQGTVRHSQNN